MPRNNDDFSYDLVEEIGVLSENARAGGRNLIRSPGTEQPLNMI